MIKKKITPIGFKEFVALLAMMISLVAFSTDAMLPALDVIGKELGVKNGNLNQMIISMIFLGLGLGQPLFGPLSDSVGRRWPIIGGFMIFSIGTLLTIFAANFTILLVGRFLQGFGASAPRTVSLSLVRDQFEGRHMAQVMSIVMSVFILVPIVAPSIGQVVLMLFGWRGIFALILAFILLVTFWFATRQPETLPREKRTHFTMKWLTKAGKEIFMNPLALGYTVIQGLVGAAFLAYLMLAQPILQNQYGTGDKFPVYFSILALFIGGASLMNSKIVLKFSMKVLVLTGLVTVISVSAVFSVVSWHYHGHPPFFLLMVYLAIILFSQGIMFGNLNAMAMEPLGHIAGIGAAVVGSLSTMIQFFLGSAIGQSYNNSVFPLVAGFGGAAVISFIFMNLIEYRSGRVKREPVIQSS